MFYQMTHLLLSCSMTAGYPDSIALGYIMLLNALAIMLYTSGYSVASWWFVGATILLFMAYSVLDVKANTIFLRKSNAFLFVNAKASGF